MKKILFSMLLLLFLGTEGVFSKNLIGKIYSQNDGSRSHVLPLLSDDKLKFDKESILRFPGGTVLAYSGSEFRIDDSSEYLEFNLSKGKLNFKIDPAKRKILFKTINGSVSTPYIYKTSSGLIEGYISIEDNNSTIVEIVSGEMQAYSSQTYSSNGDSIIEAGQAFILTRSGEVAQANVEKVDPTPGTSIYTDELPPSLQEFLSFIGEPGTANTQITDSGEITILKDKYGYKGKAKAVDFALFELNEKLEPGTPVKVVCANIDNGEENSKLFVRETDNLYPQVTNERVLLGRSIKTQTAATPHGLSKIYYSDTEDGKSTEYPGDTRSIEKWDTALINPKTLQPDFDQSVDEDTELTVVCVRSTLVLQAQEIVNDQSIGMVGKNAVSVSEITPYGKIQVDGEIYEAVLTDLNLQPKRLYSSFPEGSNFTVVGVKENNGIKTVLIQEKEEALEELLAVGQDVTLKEDSKGAWGVVNLNNNNWWGKIVDKNFQPIQGQLPAKTVLKVASIDTVLLANQPSVLAAAWLPASTSLAPLLLGAAAIPPAIAIPLVTDDSGDPPMSPINIINIQ